MPESSSISGNVYTVTLTPEIASQYTITIVITHGKYAGLKSTTLSVQTPTITEHGLEIQLTGPGSLSIGSSGNYYIILDYTNGSLLNSINTKSALANTTVQVLFGSTVMETIKPSEISNGIFTFAFSENSADSYSLKASTYLNDGAYV